MSDYTLFGHINGREDFILKTKVLKFDSSVPLPFLTFFYVVRKCGHPKNCTLEGWFLVKPSDDPVSKPNNSCLQDISWLERILFRISSGSYSDFFRAGVRVRMRVGRCEPVLSSPTPWPSHPHPHPQKIGKKLARCSEPIYQDIVIDLFW